MSYIHKEVIKTIFQNRFSVTKINYAAIPLLGMYLKEWNSVHEWDAWMLMRVAVLFSVVIQQLLWMDKEKKKYIYMYVYTH
jgi:hypothetical protein